MKKLKILGISLFGYVGKYRIDNPLRALGEKELADVHIVLNEISLDHLERFDVVVTNRQHSHQWEATIAVIKRRGRVAFVHDWDDQEFMVPRTNPARPQFSDRGSKTHRTVRAARNMAAADLITVSTPSLKEDALWYNPNVVVLRNMIDPRDWQNVISLSHPDETWMGFLGSNTHRDSVDMIVEPVTQVLRNYADLYLIICGYPEMPEIFPDDVQHKVRSMPFDFGAGDGKGHRYKRWLASVDFIVRPSFPNRFNVAKSCNPLLEAGAIGFSKRGVGVPVIVSPTTYGLAAAEADQLVASTTDQWLSYMTMLYHMAAARRWRGVKAFEYVCQYRLEKNNLQARYDAYLETYETRTSWPE